MSTIAPSNPLSPIVKQLVDGARYLNTDLSLKLYEVIKPHVPSLRVAEEEEEVTSFSLSRAMQKQMATLNRLQMIAAGSEDISELKSVMTASRDLITQMSKFKSDLESEETLRIMEDAIAEALEELGNDEIKDRFYKILSAGVEVKKQTKGLK